VLGEGKMKYLTINPVVKQGGISGARIAYPFLQPIRIEDAELKTLDTLFLGEYNETAGDYCLHANYYPKGANLRTLAECYFEPTSFSTCFDSNVVWVGNDPSVARTGQGYGKVHVADSVSIVTFGFADTMQFNPGNSRILYLELDYKTDMQLWIHMQGPSSSTGSAYISKSVQAIRPSKEWKKIYVNLGRTWSQFDYQEPISVYFQITNEMGEEGDILIDNVKVLTTN